MQLLNHVGVSILRDGATTVDFMPELEVRSGRGGGCLPPPHAQPQAVHIVISECSLDRAYG